MRSLGEIAKVFRGVTYSVNEISNVRQDGYIAVLRAGNIQDYLHIDSDLIFVQESKVKRNQIIVKDDIVMCASSGSSDLVGKSAIAKEDTDVTFGGFCLLIRANNHISCPSYINHYFRSNIFRSWAKQAQGINIKNIRKNELEDLAIPLPPLDEQRRIAAILDKADVIRRKRQETLKLADDLVKSRFIEMFGDPVANPKGWGKVNLCDAAGIISGITKGRKISGKQTFPIPYMRVANVKDGYIDLSEIKMIEATSDEATYYRLLKNDILMTEGGDPDKLGRGAIWFGQIENCIHQNHIFRVRLNNAQIHPVYFAEYLKQSVVKKYFLSCAKQTTGIASINMTQLKALPTIVPPLSLQTQFAAFVEQVDKLKFAMQRQLAEAETSKASLMQQFFS